MNKYILAFFTGIISFTTVNAQDETEGSAVATEESFWTSMPIETLGTTLIVLLALFIVTVLLLALTIDFGRFFRQKMIDDGQKVPWFLQMFGIFEGDTTILTGEYRDVVIEGHDYDGIEEYDNDMPPWWVYMFYLTIIFAVAYLLHYHVFNTGKLQAEEFQAEMEAAEEKYADVDLEYEGPETDEVVLNDIEEEFISNCAQCHGQLGEGNVGPNLTDRYWKNGGNINDIYSTIKYGVKGTGMQSWQNQYSNEEIYHLASYVVSLEGTDPPNAKEPEGEKYEREKE